MGETTFIRSRETPDGMEHTSVIPPFRMLFPPSVTVDEFIIARPNPKLTCMERVSRCFGFVPEGKPGVDETYMGQMLPTDVCLQGKFTLGVKERHPLCLDGYVLHGILPFQCFDEHNLIFGCHIDHFERSKP